MEETYYEMDLPRENIHLRCFAHSIMNYRYHWHPDEYELSIVLKGNQEYCRGTETHSLFEDDLILTAPGNGHASMRQQLPALAGTPPRYVVWGEGTADEMCLAILVNG